MEKLSQKQSRSTVPGSQYKEHVEIQMLLEKRWILLCKFIHDSLIDDGGVLHLVKLLQNTSPHDYVFAGL